MSLRHFWCVLRRGSEVCIVQRLKWQEVVRMCARKVQWVSNILDCEPSVGLRSLKVGLLVVVTVLQLAALLWTHWAWTLVKIWKHENNWSWSFGFLCCVVGMCCNGSVEYTASILRVTMTFVFGMCRCTARIGVVVNLVTLSNPPHCWLYRGVHNFLTHMSPLHIPTCWP